MVLVADACLHGRKWQNYAKMKFTANHEAFETRTTQQHLIDYSVLAPMDYYNRECVYFPPNSAADNQGQEILQISVSRGGKKLIKPSLLYINCHECSLSVFMCSLNLPNFHLNGIFQE